jgi:hypothetical protein
MTRVLDRHFWDGLLLQWLHKSGSIVSIRDRGGVFICPTATRGFLLTITILGILQDINRLMGNHLALRFWSSRTITVYSTMS